MLGDEVSMTKITHRPDQAAVAAKVPDLDQRGAVHLDPVPPLDHDRALLAQPFAAEVAELSVALHPTQVDMRQPQPPGIYPHELAGRAGHLRLRAPPAPHA